MRTATKIAIVVTGLTAGSMLGAPPSYASGDAPWCAVTEVGDGDGQWDCHYETVEECVPAVLAGNRGHCNQNPWTRDSAPAPAAVSAPTTAPVSTTPSTVQNRKAIGMQNNANREETCLRRGRFGGKHDVWRACSSCVRRRTVVLGHGGRRGRHGLELRI
jgi:hypothetical protein